MESFVQEKRLCKTWYATKAYETKGNNKRRNNTEKEKGSTFTFNKDYTFELQGMSRRGKESMKGKWKNTGKNTISIFIKDFEMEFQIVKLTRDSLYIIGSEIERRN